MTNAKNPRQYMPTSDTTTLIHYECGSDSSRVIQIEFDPPSVTLLLPGGKSMNLHEGTWEYGFASEQPLDLHFVGKAGMSCTLNGETMNVTGEGLNWTVTRPTSEDMDEEFVFRFGVPLRTAAAAAAPGLIRHDSGSTSAQPTLKIRTKRNCPVGVTNPTADM